MSKTFRTLARVVPSGNVSVPEMRECSMISSCPHSQPATPYLSIVSVSARTARPESHSPLSVTFVRLW